MIDITYTEKCLRRSYKKFQFTSSPLVYFYYITVRQHPVQKVIIYGNSLSIPCKHKENESASPIWFFNEQILFAHDFEPQSIGLTNVRGEIVNSTYSFLHFKRFSTANVGTYECFFARETHASYKLIMKGM